MLVKLFWLLAVVMYAAAAYVASSGGEGAIDYRFWLLIGLGTLSAVLGNTIGYGSWDDKPNPRAPHPGH